MSDVSVLAQRESKPGLGSLPAPAKDRDHTASVTSLPVAGDPRYWRTLGGTVAYCDVCNKPIMKLFWVEWELKDDAGAPRRGREQACSKVCFSRSLTNVVRHLKNLEEGGYATRTQITYPISGRWATKEEHILG